MLTIKYNNNWYDFDFNGIKVIETKYTTNFIKKIFHENNNTDKVIIDGKNYNWKNIIYINELTKINDFLSLSKNGYLYKKIIDKIEDNSLINQDLINAIIAEINKEMEIEDLLFPTYDLNKIIASTFELGDLGFINDESFFQILNKIDYDEKKLIIFDNCNFINYGNVKKLLNNFNILIICNDIRGIIRNYNELEICCFINNSVFEVINIEKLVSYLELKLSEPISEQDLNNYLLFDDSKKSSVINFCLKNL